MAKKKPSVEPQPSHAMTIRIPGDLYQRIEKVAKLFALDPTSFVRMMMRENIAEYERRGEKFQ